MAAVYNKIVVIFTITAVSVFTVTAEKFPRSTILYGGLNIFFSSASDNIIIFSKKLPPFF
jgi:hypothetical protein